MSQYDKSLAAAGWFFCGVQLHAESRWPLMLVAIICIVRFIIVKTESN